MRNKWLPEEDAAFVKALDTFNLGQWDEIAQAIGTKSVEQVKYRASYLLKQSSSSMHAYSSELHKRLTEIKNTMTESSSARTTTTTTASPSKSKRTYAKRQQTTAAAAVVVPVDEEISIVSSSSSSSSSRSSKESINIMSSSSSSSSSSFESLKSAASTETVASKESCTSNASSTSSVASQTLTMSAKSNNTSQSTVTATALAKPPIKRLGMTRRMMPVVMKPAKIGTASEAKSNGSVDAATTERKHENDSVTEVKQKQETIETATEALPKDTDAFAAEVPENTIAVPPEQVELTPVKPATTSTSIPATPGSKRGRKQTPKSSTEEFEDAADTDAQLLIRKLAAASTRRRKIRSEDGEWIDPAELEGRTIDHQPPPPPEPKRRRKYTRKIDNPDDPFRLIWLNDYSMDADATEDERPPFRVEIDASVVCLLDFHAHLFSSEIIGLLGGTFDPNAGGGGGLLRISAVFPCKSAHSTGTEVDVDPLSEMEAGEFFERSGVRMIGWYHSHPNFEPNPSLRDLETQTMYQGLCRSVDGGQEAFVGIIVNPYLAMTESSSHIECFYVAQSSEAGVERLPFRMNLETTGQIDEAMLLGEMRKLVLETATSSDALDMQKNAETDVKRIDKLLRSLATHAGLDVSHPFLSQVEQLFAKPVAIGTLLHRTEEDYSF